jgi:vacuolar-type H+-ATPase subunit E/Vma4
MSTLALSKIEEEILTDAQEEAKRRVAEVEKEAVVALEKVKTEAQSEVEAVKAATQEKIKVLERKKLSEARRNAAIMVLQEKNSLVDTAFKEALKRIKELRGKEVHEKSARHLLEESIKRIGSGDMKLQVSHNDHKLYEDAIKSLNTPTGVSIAMVKEALHAAGGFILSTADDRVKLDNTLEARLEFATKSLRKEIAAILLE